MDISFGSYPCCSKLFTMTFCTWHDSCDVAARAKLCSDRIQNDGVTLKPIFLRIWIMMDKSFVKWARGLVTDDIQQALLSVVSVAYGAVHWPLVRRGEGDVGGVSCFVLHLTRRFYAPELHCFAWSWMASLSLWAPLAMCQDREWLGSGAVLFWSWVRPVLL